MGAIKTFFYIITLLFVTFPIGIGCTEAHLIPAESEQIEVKYLNDSQLNHMDSLLMRRLKANGFKGTALVAYKGQIIMKYANGYSDYRTKEKINTESCFQLASVSKSFTSTAVMMLYEKGQIQYDDPVQNYIPEFPYPNISIRNLLQHTSGLQNYMYLVDHYWKNDSLITNEDVLDLLVEHQLPLNNKPGARFTYSNTGYVMLALLVERVSGEKFSTFVDNNIFKPIGMDRSFTFNYSIIDTLSNKAVGYNRVGRRLFRYDYEPNDLVLGDKSIFSTVEDLFRYQKALNSFKLVKEETLLEAYTKGQTESRYKRSFNYGFGWRFKKDKNRNFIYHNGLWHGFVSTLTREIDHDITVILLNNTSASISSIKNDLINISIRELSKMNIQETTVSSSEIAFQMISEISTEMEAE